MWKLFKKLHKAKLDKVSPSFCLAKWTQSTIYLSSGSTHSCHLPPAHYISVDDIKKNPSSLNNTSFKIQQRKMMLEGIKPTECSHCWNIESTGQLSDRVLKSSTPWARPYFSNVIDAGFENDYLTYLEVSFDNTCNLKCSYCGPENSSKWVEELERFGKWPDEVSNHGTYKIIKNNEHNPFVEAFWSWFPTIYSQLDTFRITGGEPLLSKNLHKTLEFIIENPNKKLNFSVNSNLSVPEKALDSFISSVKHTKVKSLTIHTSCDTVGVQAEYARNGLDYEQWLKNCRRILTELPYAKLNIMVTYNLFSIPSFVDFLKDMLELKKKKWYQRNRVTLAISYLRAPEELSIASLPIETTEKIISQVNFMKHNNFSSSEITQLERIIPFINNSPEEKIRLKKKFKIFIDEHDRRRGTSFINSFPELKEFYETC